MMRVLVLSDIHANLTALEAVLEAAEGEYDGVWCLGDVIGYGPDPNECVEMVQSLPNLVCLAGNHDRAVVDDLDLEIFNVDAYRALSWTRAVLRPQHKNYLQNLPSMRAIDLYTLVHGSLYDPVWEYLLEPDAIITSFQLLLNDYCLFGHTHLPIVYHLQDNICQEMYPDYQNWLSLAEGKFLINPGSVGQPRNSQPDACFGLLDTDSNRFLHCRVPYDVAATQSRMADVDLPSRLIHRISQGW